MAESRSHITTANRLANKFKTDYNKDKGPDIKTDKLVIEVENENSVSEASRQLRGFNKPVYVAGTNQKAVQKAVEKYKNTTIGVMNNQSKIVKRSTRKK